MAVVLRVRPPSPRERAAPPVLHVLNERVVLLSPEEPGGIGDTGGTAPPARSSGRYRKNLKFVFDHVFDERATQEEVFRHTTLPLLDTLLAGYDCSGESSDPCRSSCPIPSQAGWAQQSPGFNLEAPMHLWEWGDTTATPNHTA